MVLKRIIPCLLFDGTSLVKTVRFRDAAYVGDPVNAIKIYNEKEVDELLLLDIRATREGRPPKFDQVAAFAAECFMPFTYGGGVRTLDDFARLYKSGVEKVVVNTLCFTDPDAVRRAVDRYGSSSVVGAVDYRKPFWGAERVYRHADGRRGGDVLAHCRYLAGELGVGELLLYAADRDGTWEGYDLPLIRAVADAVPVPLVACGGAGCLDDLRQVLYTTRAHAAALGAMAVYQRKGMGVLINFPRRADVIVDPVAEAGFDALSEVEHAPL